MAVDYHVGTKYLWTGNEGVLEMHGQQKVPWTKLNDHLFKDSVAAEVLEFKQSKQNKDQHGGTLTGRRLGQFELFVIVQKVLGTVETNDRVSLVFGCL